MREQTSESTCGEKLFVDNSLLPALARGLHALFDGSLHVEHIRAKFWCVLSGDRNIAKRKPSRAAFHRANVVGFFPLPAIMTLPSIAVATRLLIVWYCSKRPSAR